MNKKLFAPLLFPQILHLCTLDEKNPGHASAFLFLSHLSESTDSNTCDKIAKDLIKEILE